MQTPTNNIKKTRSLLVVFLSLVLLCILAAYIYYGMYYAKQSNNIDTPVSLDTAGTTINAEYTSLEARRQALEAIATSGDGISEEVRRQAMEDSMKSFEINAEGVPVAGSQPVPTYAERQAALENVAQESSIVNEPVN
jgi:flagellar basal body-associated protein FliL